MKRYGAIDAVQRAESWVITFAGCKHDQDNCSHYWLSPALSENMTLAGLCAVAECPVVILAHLNPLD